MFSWKRNRPSHERALDWFKANTVPGQGIIVHTRQPVPYPEVTGYFIPTLHSWNEPELARTCTRWLMSIQLPEGWVHKRARYHFRRHFRLEKHAQVDKITVQWSSRVVQKLRGIKANQVLLIKETQRGAKVMDTL